jgi:hypothetical protein
MLVLYPPLIISFFLFKCPPAVFIRLSFTFCISLVTYAINILSSGVPNHKSSVCLLKLLQWELFRLHLGTFSFFVIFFHNCPIPQLSCDLNMLSRTVHMANNVSQESTWEDFVHVTRSTWLQSSGSVTYSGTPRVRKCREVYRPISR